MAASNAVIEIRGLTKRFRGGVTAVERVDLIVEEGHVLGLAGPNGSGKSVMLRVLLGLVRPSAGRVLLFGERIRPGAPALRRVGALVDGPGFVPHLSGLENLRLALQLTRCAEADGDLEHALDIARLGPAIHRPYRTYSHGMRYRLGLAQALLGRPDLLLLDEPTTGLDPVHFQEVHRAVAVVVRRGATVVLSSHLMSQVEQLCTHIAVMEGGRILASGAVDDLVGDGHRTLDEVYLDLFRDAPARHEPAVAAK